MRIRALKVTSFGMGENNELILTYDVRMGDEDREFHVTTDITFKRKCFELKGNLIKLNNKPKDFVVTKILEGDPNSSLKGKEITGTKGTKQLIKTLMELIKDTFAFITVDVTEDSLRILNFGEVA